MFEACEFIPVCAPVVAVMGEKNFKRRIYIAYYRRTPTPSLPVKYHTSLLMTPKNSTMMSKDIMQWTVWMVTAVKGFGFLKPKSYARSTRLAGHTAWEGTSLGIRSRY